MLEQNYGSFKLVDINGTKVTFYGLSADVSSLPTDLDVSVLGSGSVAYCIDNGTVYMYEETNKQWYEQ